MHGEGPTVFIVISAKFARAASPGCRIASTFAVAPSVNERARARAATIDTDRKKSSRAKVYIRARSEEMREERARYLGPPTCAEGKRTRARASTAPAYEIRRRARAPLRRKVKAPVKDAYGRNVWSVGVGMPEIYVSPLSCRFRGIRRWSSWLALFFFFTPFCLQLS